MKRIINGLMIIVFVSLLAAPGIMAEPWEQSFNLGLNVTQSSYSNSWTGGEEGNVTWAAGADGVFTKQMSPKFKLKNTIKLAFGQTMTQDKETRDWSRPQKSTDKIDLEALGRLTLDAWVDPYVAFRFESQFLDASVDTNKRYINPMLLTESAGIAKTLFKKEKDEILSRLGFAVKENINRGAVSPTDPAKTETISSMDGGLESVSDVKMVLNDKLGYVGKLSLYKAFFFSKKNDFKGTEAEDYWKAVDINWENTVTASISKYIQVTFYTQLLYDKQISKKGRLKETLALGLTYKLL
ncbi:MAG: hypothetical protein CVT49_02120 [candidate division Zixibacteria bacterium HGW-Zixibacteria-1]|nr:MAG: hypothetical protein CVT49_02120 [candidate division Zixibacteria bacterium HGW-Zixibacteria-1]